jgi:hypothetical protein
MVNTVCDICHFFAINGNDFQVVSKTLIGVLTVALCTVGLSPSRVYPGYTYSTYVRTYVHATVVTYCSHTPKKFRGTLLLFVVLIPVCISTYSLLSPLYPKQSDTTFTFITGGYRQKSAGTKQLEQLAALAVPLASCLLILDS